MFNREDFFPKKESAFSIKSILMTATIVVFLILHIIGAMFIHRAATAQSTDTAVLAMSGD